MNRLLMVALAASTMAAAPALAAGEPKSGDNNPTATHDNPSACLGAERATRNSNGGDRAQGGFGPAQSATAQSADPNYGQWLQMWLEENC